MIKTIAPVSALAALVCLSGPAFAAHHEEAEKQEAPKAEIVQRGPDGRAEVVRIDGYEYQVCKEGQTDSCINPRDAGLDWGGKEIDYWPGKPASEIDEPLPAEKPAELPD